MEELKARLREEGRGLGSSIVKVDDFLNHQLDVRFLENIGCAFAERFSAVDFDRILTVETSGIAVAMAAAACMNYPPLVFARKAIPRTLNGAFYQAEARSFTKGTVSTFAVAEKYIHKGERVLILDDFLAAGEAFLALSKIVEDAGAVVAGIGAVIEKRFQGGSAKLRAKGYRVESLAVIERIENGEIIFAAD